MTSFRELYKKHGVDTYYTQHASTYSNPHEPDIHKCLDDILKQWNPSLNNVLDLACGSGEITRHIKANNIIGIDPYTFNLYKQKTGKNAMAFSFEDIADGVLGYKSQYDLIVCSYALHLIDASRLPSICYYLAQASPKLLIISPHKRPHIKQEWGWTLIGEHIVNKTHGRWYERNR